MEAAQRAGDQAARYGANGVLRAVNGRLAGCGVRGFVALDRFRGTSAITFLEEKCSMGLIYTGANPRVVSLDRFMAFRATSVKASRIQSAIDVPPGAFGYCLSPDVHGKAAEVPPLVMCLVSKNAAGFVGWRGDSFYPKSLQQARAHSYNAVAGILGGNV